MGVCVHTHVCVICTHTHTHTTQRGCQVEWEGKEKNGGDGLGPASPLFSLSSPFPPIFSSSFLPFSHSLLRSLFLWFEWERMGIILKSLTHWDGKFISLLLVCG